jgi:predicted MPP superfamily phosphohydrolase
MDVRKEPRRYSRLRLILYKILVRLFTIADWGKRIYARNLRKGALDIVVQAHGCDDPMQCFRVAHLSDFHAGPYLDHSILDHVVAQVNELDPHVLVYTGDYITDGPEDVDLVMESLEKIRSPLGGFAVFGNHDYRHRREDYMVERFSQASILTLRNAAARVDFKGRAFWFLGIEDIEEGKFPDLDAALREVDGEGLRILLSHNPDVVRILKAGMVDVVLSGHTHGGQIRLPLLGDWGSGYQGGFRAGLHFHHENRLYVNRGIGCLVVPLRLNAPAEITLHLFPL